MRLVKDYFLEKINPDQAVCTRLEEWYRHRPSLKSIEVVVIDGVAILQGRITRSADRALAIDLALDAGARDVVDELTLYRPLAARQASGEKLAIETGS
jgi:BON domain